MFTRRLLIILAIINGLMLPILLAFLMLKLWQDEQRNAPYRSDGDGAIVGKRLAEAIGNNKALQGVYHYLPREIPNSPLRYLPLYIKTYEEAKEMENMMNLALDLNPFMDNVFDVLFLDSNYVPKRRLLNKKGFISKMELPNAWITNSEGKYIQDTTGHHIAYLIGFEDTNSDDLLDENDQKDLYLSELDGSNLIKVVHDIDIIEFSFQENHSEIFIQYYERMTEKAEYKRMRFGVYKIKSKQFVPQRQELEKYLREIEKTLQLR
jgi:hypothetical protein